MLVYSLLFTTLSPFLSLPSEPSSLLAVTQQVSAKELIDRAIEGF